MLWRNSSRSSVPAQTPQTETSLLFFFLPHSTLPKQVFLRRWLSFSLASLATYVLLDRSTVYLQIWHSISAWYPPVGFEFALFIGLGEAAFPAMFLSGFVGGLLNYHQSPTRLEFLLVNPLIPTLYYSASRFVRRRLNPDLYVRSMRDVINLLLFSLAASCASAAVGTAILTFAGNVPVGDYMRQGRCRSRKPLQKRISRQHEPRNSHAHERHPRHGRSSLRYHSQYRAA